MNLLSKINRPELYISSYAFMFIDISLTLYQQSAFKIPQTAVNKIVLLLSLLFTICEKRVANGRRVSPKYCWY